MAIVWKTPAGNLGTIPDEEYYQLDLDAIDTTGDEVTYKVISGSLPSGLRVDQNGQILGVPNAGLVEGVPTAVNRVTTSTFTVRASNAAGALTDRTFNLTVAGVSVLQIEPKNVELGEFYDGGLFHDDLHAGYYQLNAINFVTTNSLTWKLTSGSLPPGLTLQSDGKIVGFVDPTPVNADTETGFDASLFDKLRFDSAGIKVSKTFQFKVQVTDGVNVDSSTYTIKIINRSSLTGDSGFYTADLVSIIEASEDSRYSPILRNLDTTLEPVRQGGYYAYKFDGYDYDLDELTYEVIGTLPAGLSISPTTGWLTGFIPIGPLGTVDYTFTVKVYKTGNEFYSTQRTFVMSLLGQVENTVTWTTTSDLGSIDLGEISTLQVMATTASNKPLQYRIVYEEITAPDFAGSKLPQGLKLLSDGTIVGRVTFDSFSIDNGETTFDDRRTLTTFDTTYTFTVNAYDSDGFIDSYKTFFVKLNSRVSVPYENLYIKALPTPSQRAIYSKIINDSDIFPDTDIYRPADPWFGKNTSIKSLFLTGLTASSLSDYIQAMARNHYWKKITFGDVKTAQALDSEFNVKYEVVYVDLIDDSLSETGESPSANVAIRPNSAGITNLYPNSFKNMSDQLIEHIGYKNKSILPAWMTSRQTNGRVLGFTRALVLCYTKPGKSQAIAYRVRRELSGLRLVDFTIDRYELDNSLSTFYDLTTREFSTFTAATGSISSSTTDTAVVGTDTQFTAELAVGQTLKTADGDAIGRIEMILDDTNLKLFNNALTTVSEEAFQHSMGETVFDNTNTYFDHKQTQFFTNRAVESTPDQDEQYLKFPHITIADRPVATV